jgi:hypothetical protein
LKLSRINKNENLRETESYMDHVIKEAVEIRLCPDNFCRDLGLTVN